TSFGELRTSVRRALRPDQRLKPFIVLCAVWVGIYLCFLLWIPFNTFYRLFYLPPLVALIGVALASASGAAEPSRRRYRLAMFVALLALSNFLFLIYPYSQTQKNKPLLLALEMNAVWPPGTVVYYDIDNSDANLFRYIDPQTLWKQLPPESAGVSEDELKQVYRDGHAAWLEATAIDKFSSTTVGSNWLKAHARNESWREIKDPAYNIRFVQIAP